MRPEECPAPPVSEVMSDARVTGQRPLGPLTKLNMSKRRAVHDSASLSVAWDECIVDFKVFTQKHSTAIRTAVGEWTARPSTWKLIETFDRQTTHPVIVRFMVLGVPSAADAATIRAFLNLIK